VSAASGSSRTAWTSRPRWRTWPAAATRSGATGSGPAPGGRLIIGKTNERRDDVPLADRLVSWGYDVAGSVSRPHEHPGVVVTLFWVDA
jgi:hypothetical protein